MKIYRSILITIIIISGSLNLFAWYKVSQNYSTPDFNQISLTNIVGIILSILNLITFIPTLFLHYKNSNLAPSHKRIELLDSINNNYNQNFKFLKLCYFTFGLTILLFSLIVINVLFWQPDAPDHINTLGYFFILTLITIGILFIFDSLKFKEK